MKKTPVCPGSGVAIVTPFKDGKVNFEKLGELIDFQIAGGTSSIIICGTTGESSTQSLEEHVATVDYCVKYVNGRVPVIAGAGQMKPRGRQNSTEKRGPKSQNPGAERLLYM